MSGFLLAADRPLATSWGERLCFVPEAHAWPLSLGQWRGVQVTLDTLAPVPRECQDSVGNRLVLIGRVFPPPELWSGKNAIDLAGDLSNALLEAWRSDREHFADLLNGPAIALIWEARAEILHVYTDRMGIFPVYGTVRGPLRLGSHADVLADLLASEGRPCPVDLTSLAEALATGCGVPPYTYHQGIRQLEAASHYEFSRAAEGMREQRRDTWQPLAPRDSENAADLADALAAEIVRATQRRNPNTVGPLGLLLSGGADSRALLFAASDPAGVRTVTFCDQSNPEARTAERLAKIAGAKHRTLLRQPEHYGEGATFTVRVTGGMWSIKDAHFCGFLSALREIGVGNLMTGCYTDYLYKGLAYNRVPRRFLGKALPIDEMGSFATEFYQPHFRLAPRWQKSVETRLVERYPLALRSRYAARPEEIEDLRLRPLSREADAMGRLFLLRTVPWDPVMTDFALLPFYRRLGPAHKLNAQVFRQAVLRLLPLDARSVPNNNDGLPLASSEARRAIHYVLQMSRRKFAVLFGRRPEPSLGTEGSWPDFPYYVAHSKVLQHLWDSPSPAMRDLFGELLGQDPWKTSLPNWAAQGSDLVLRMITLRVWLGLRGI